MRRIRLSNPPSKYPNAQKDQSVRIGLFVVGEDGFEPSKRYAADLQSVPFGHSGTPPYAIVCLNRSEWSRQTDSFNQGAARSSPHRQRSSALHFIVRVFQQPKSEWSRQTDSNPRPADYKSAALPTELCRQLKQNTLIIATAYSFVKSYLLKIDCFFKKNGKHL